MVNDSLDSNEELEEALTSLFESSEQAEYDFCGDQRDWHLPRLQRAAALLVKLFPLHSLRAMEAIKSPHD